MRRPPLTKKGTFQNPYSFGTLFVSWQFRGCLSSEKGIDAVKNGERMFLFLLASPVTVNVIFVSQPFADVCEVCLMPTVLNDTMTGTHSNPYNYQIIQISFFDLIYIYIYIVFNLFKTFQDLGVMI